MEKKDKFATIFLQALDIAFLALGKDVMLSIYSRLQDNFNLPKQEIPNRVKDFADAIETIFGSASKPLEILIMKCLNEKICCNYIWVGPKWLIPELTFEQFIELAQESFKNSIEVEGSYFTVLSEERLLA